MGCGKSQESPLGKKPTGEDHEKRRAIRDLKLLSESRNDGLDKGGLVDRVCRNFDRARKNIMRSAFEQIKVQISQLEYSEISKNSNKNDLSLKQLLNPNQAKLQTKLISSLIHPNSLLLNHKSSFSSKDPTILSCETITLTLKPQTRPLFISNRKRNIKKSLTMTPSKLAPAISNFSTPSKISTARPKSINLTKPNQNPKSPIKSPISINQHIQTVEKLNKRNQINIRSLLFPFGSYSSKSKNIEICPNPLQFLSLFEEIMDCKSQDDEFSIKNENKPKEFYEFFSQYIREKYSTNNQILLNLCLVLEQNSDISQIKMMQKLIGCSSDCQYPLGFSIYLCKLSSYFNRFTKNTIKLYKKYEKFQKYLKNPELSLPPEKSSSLFQTFEYVIKRFKEPLISSYILPLLKPNSLCPAEFLIFYSVYKSRKSGCNIFKLPSKDYFSAILSFIDFPITEEQKDSLSSFLNTSTKESLKSCLSLSNHPKNIMNPKYWITKEEFLSVIVKSFEYFRDRSIAELAEMTQGFENIRKEQFVKMIEELDPLISGLQAEQLFLFHCCLAGKDILDKESAIYAVIESGIGIIKFFCIF